MAVTRLGLSGFSRPPYGSFAGKTLTTLSLDVQNAIGVLASRSARGALETVSAAGTLSTTDGAGVLTHISGTGTLI